MFIVIYSLYYRLAHLFGIAEESFLRATEDVMEALLSKIDQLIRWPNAHELPHYAAQFDAIGR